MPVCILPPDHLFPIRGNRSNGLSTFRKVQNEEISAFEAWCWANGNLSGRAEAAKDRKSGENQRCFFRTHGFFLHSMDLPFCRPLPGLIIKGFFRRTAWENAMVVMDR